MYGALRMGHEVGADAGPPAPFAEGCHARTVAAKFASVRRAVAIGSFFF